MASAADFDEWYTNIADSAVHGTVHRKALGLPPEVDSSSLLPWAGVAEVATVLELAAEDQLVDLACGFGGYGLEVARRTGARLTGVDFSSVAVAAACRNISRFGLDGHAAFRVGDLTATGLSARSVDAVMCIDAIQFADPPLAGLVECRRILAAGGRLAVTCWEPVDPADDQVPARLRKVNLARDLAEAGFEDVDVLDKAAWRPNEHALWEAALQLPPDSDPAVKSMQKEGAGVQTWFDRTRRVLATATAPL
jgi:SAM-dependent methyltransferase